MRRQIAIIGAGIAGLNAARELALAGFDLTLFEKSRGVGGRMATRRDGDGLTFDHGAQYFTARDPQFRETVKNWQQQQWITTWPQHGFAICRQGQFTLETSPPPRFVGIPGMTSIAKNLAAKLAEQNIGVKLNTRICRIDTQTDRFELTSELGDSLGNFSAVLLAIPAEQAADLLDSNDPFSSKLRRQLMQPCWATMARLQRDLPVDWEGCFVHGSSIRWVARNHTKPGRAKSPPTIVLHAEPEWTARHWEVPAAQIAGQMLAEFWRATGLEPIESSMSTAHRWKYAISASASDKSDGSLVDADDDNQKAAATAHPSETSTSQWPWHHDHLPLVACGDWAMSGRIEGAYLSGRSAADWLKDRLA